MKIKVIGSRPDNAPLPAHQFFKVFRPETNRAEGNNFLVKKSFARGYVLIPYRSRKKL